MVKKPLSEYPKDIVYMIAGRMTVKLDGCVVEKGTEARSWHYCTRHEVYVVWS